MNILEALGTCSNEDVVSNLLRYCIEVSPPFRNAFLQSVCGIEPSEVRTARAFTRVSADSAGIPDLVIAAEGSRKKHLVILENKLKADEGSDQTHRYSTPECVLEIKDRVGWSGSAATQTFVFLTLFPDQEPGAQVFRQATYQDILKASRDLPHLGDPLAQLLLDAWTELLRGFYSKASISPEDILLNKLKQRDPLEGNYLYFKSFAQSLQLSRGLELEYTFRSSAQGRRYFGAVISKSSWHPGEMQETAGGYRLDGEKHFNIHFEPQFHYLKGVMELYVHYEVNPYNTAEWVKSHVPPAQFEVYNRVREEFVNRLRAKHSSDLVIGGRTNQIAKAALTLERATVSAARSAIGDVINRVAVHIDQIRDDPKGVFAS